MIFRDYAAVLEKMLSNGYEQPLSLSPRLSLTCDTPRIYPLGSSLSLDERCPSWKCYQEGDEKEEVGGKIFLSFAENNSYTIPGLFQLVSQRTGSKTAVLAQDLESELVLEKITTTRCSNTQLWRIDGQKIINGDGQPMTLDGASFELVPNTENTTLVYLRAAGTEKYLKPRAGKLEVALGAAEYEWQIIRI